MALTWRTVASVGVSLTLGQINLCARVIFTFINMLNPLILCNRTDRFLCATLYWAPPKIKVIKALEISRRTVRYVVRDKLNNTSHQSTSLTKLSC